MRSLHLDHLPSEESEAWIENQELMLFACFQVLENFVEKEVPSDFFEGEWLSNFTQEREFRLEVIQLYDFWKERRKYTYNKDFSKLPERGEGYQKRLIQWHDNIEARDAKDQEMLKRLIEIRPALWI